jgi:hypothetical protein
VRRWKWDEKDWDAWGRTSRSWNPYFTSHPIFFIPFPALPSFLPSHSNFADTQAHESSSSQHHPTTVPSPDITPIQQPGSINCPTTCLSKKDLCVNHWLLLLLDLRRRMLDWGILLLFGTSFSLFRESPSLKSYYSHIEVISHHFFRSSLPLIPLGPSLIISGAGPIGLVTALAAHAAGCTPIVLTDLVQSRLEFAKTLLPNIRTVQISKGQSPEEVAGMIKSAAGGMVNVALECTGFESSIRTAIFVSHPTRAGSQRSHRGRQEGRVWTGMEEAFCL